MAGGSWRGDVCGRDIYVEGGCMVRHAWQGVHGGGHAW